MNVYVYVYVCMYICMYVCMYGQTNCPKGSSFSLDLINPLLQTSWLIVNNLKNNEGGKKKEKHFHTQYCSKNQIK